MNTKLLMIISTTIMTVGGLALTFFPQEILYGFGLGSAGYFSVLLQVTGALYLGFAMLNWMAKGFLLGGIYNRPITMANFLHYFIACLAIIKVAADLNNSYVWAAALIYAILASCFGYMLFTHPMRVKSPDEK